MTCPACRAAVPEGRFCVSCGADMEVADADATRLSTDPGPSSAHPRTAKATVSGLTATPTSSTSGWLAASGSIDHGRFEPGAVLEGRYRILGLLGRGGMGEVYRADDLRLGQQVAVKLLPDSLASDPQRLSQFHNEVRTAREVSHPNVCRVYDIGDLAVEADGEIRHQLFLTMEYVDGEDLSALLRRIGRLPEDKALDIARQLCAGLAAAHRRGVIHRDLKPANIMLDSAGQVRVMDFSLAAIGTVTDVRSGTPAYMAPEQLAGTGVSPASDVFALGLVLYELFTGQRAFQVKTLGELIEVQQTGRVTPPTALVPSLNPAIERAILSCLQPQPDQRPTSALAVSAALPGGDPLAMAIAAGETPSPQMVAAAGDASARTTTPLRVLWLTATLVLLGGVALLAGRLTLDSQIPFERSPASLYDRARDLERAFGVPASVTDSAWGTTVQRDFLAWMRAQANPSLSTQVLASGEPPAVVFWYRSSPNWLLPLDRAVSEVDPPPTRVGMTHVVLTLDGRLLSFERLPAQMQPAGGSAPPVDWGPFFAAAGLNPDRLVPVEPTYSSRGFADTRVAWTGTWPGVTADLRIEAGSADGRPVYFRTFGPWTLVEGEPEASQSVALVEIVASLVGPALMLAAAFVARANLRAGKGDRAGAMRLATIMAVTSVTGWLFAAHHVADVGLEQSRVFDAMGSALFGAGVIWLFYLAAEPYVRRTWPHMLITWSRVLAGSHRDALVGRDLLVGACIGVAMTAISYGFHLVPHTMGWPAFSPPTPEILLGTRDVLARICSQLSAAINNAMLGVLGLSLLRATLQRATPMLSRTINRTGLAFAIATLLFTPLAANGQFQSGLLGVDLSFGLVLVVLILGLIFRFGLLAGIVGFFCHFWTWGGALTLDPQRPYFETSLVSLSLVAIIAVTGFVLTSRATDVAA